MMRYEIGFTFGFDSNSPSSAVESLSEYVLDLMEAKDTLKYNCKKISQHFTKKLTLVRSLVLEVR